METLVSSPTTHNQGKRYKGKTKLLVVIDNFPTIISTEKLLPCNYYFIYHLYPLTFLQNTLSLQTTHTFLHQASRSYTTIIVLLIWKQWQRWFILDSDKTLSLSFSFHLFWMILTFFLSYINTLMLMITETYSFIGWQVSWNPSWIKQNNGCNNSRPMSMRQ